MFVIVRKSLVKLKRQKLISDKNEFSLLATFVIMKLYSKVKLCFYFYFYFNENRTFVLSQFVINVAFCNKKPDAFCNKLLSHFVIK